MSASYRTGRYGLRIPEYDQAFDPLQPRVLSDTVSWINGVLRANHESLGIDNWDADRNIVLVGTKTLPLLGFREGYTGEGEGRHLLREIYTAHPRSVSGFVPILRILPGYINDEYGYHITSGANEQVLFHGEEYHQGEDRVRSAIQPLVRHILDEIDYGMPSVIAPGMLPFPDSLSSGTTVSWE